MAPLAARNLSARPVEAAESRGGRGGSARPPWAAGMSAPCVLGVGGWAVSLGLLTSATALSAAGGIGGGGLFVPLLMLLMGLPTHECVGLSTSIAMGSTLANVFLNAGARDPGDARRSAFNWEAIAFLEPATIAGTVVGVAANELVSERSLTLLAAALLAWLAWRTLGQGVGRWRLEQSEQSMRAAVGLGDKQLEAAPRPAGVDAARATVVVAKVAASIGAATEAATAAPAPRSEDMADTVLVVRGGGAGNGRAAQAAPAEGQHAKSAEGSESEAESEEDERGGLLGRASAKGKGGAPALAVDPPETGVRDAQYVATILMPTLVNSVGDVGLSVLHIRPLVAIALATSLAWVSSLFVARRIMHVDMRQQWMQSRHFARFPAYCSVAGFLAGFVGIGGGMIKAPLMLEFLLLHPTVVRLSSSFMVVITSGATVLQFYFAGTYPLALPTLLFLVGGVGGVGGNSLINSVVARHPSAVVLSMGAAMAVASLLSLFTWIGGLVGSGGPAVSISTSAGLAQASLVCW